MIRNIQIRLKSDADRLESARAILLKLPGCNAASVTSGSLDVTYDLAQTNAAIIVGLVASAGLPVVLNLRQRTALWLRYYQEAIFRENQNDESGWDSCIREIYVSRYRHRRHGRRDDRPRHWRKYEARPEYD